jgi:Tol biopolymer transport system component
MTQLTQGSGETVDHVSPDGKWILFRRLQEPRTVWRMAVIGGEAEMQFEDAEGILGYSPDGAYLAHFFLKEVNGRLRVFVRIAPPAGGEPVLEFMPPGEAHFYQFYRWLHDSSALAYVHTIDGVSNIWKQPVAGGDPIQLTHFTEGRMSRFECSADGSVIVLTRLIGEREGLWSVGVDGGGATQLLDPHGRNVFDFAFSKDQNHVVLVVGDMTSDVVLIRDASAEPNL